MLILRALVACAIVACCQIPRGAIAENPADREAVIDSLEAVIAAFNQQDAAKVAAGWSSKGVHVDDDTSVRTEGREAIHKMYAAVFAAGGAPKLAVHVSKVHFATADVAVVDGLAQVTQAKEEEEGVSQTCFVAVMVNQQGKWLLDNVRECERPLPPKPADRLAALAWMVGDWEDETEGVSVKTSVRWSSKKAFLVRTFSVLRDNKAEREGTQIFGWDAEQETFRTWIFGSEGSFGEGLVRIESNRLTIKLKGLTPDGKRGSSTQVWTRLDDNAVLVQTIARELDGEPQETYPPVKVVRVKLSSPTNAADAKPVLEVPALDGK